MDIYNFDTAPFPKLRSAYLRAIARAWRDPIYEKRLLLEGRTPKNPRGALRLLEEDFKFHFPFDVKLVFDVKHRPVFNPVYAGSWFGYADEFMMYLPVRPRRKQDEADVLARYLDKFPTMLGQGEGGVEAPSSFASFGLLTGQLIALTWYEPKFAAALFLAPDGRALVQDALDTVVPWNFHLNFELQKGDSTKDDYWDAFPCTTITLNLPKRPEEPELEAVALAAYNATGGQYPFTCG